MRIVLLLLALTACTPEKTTVCTMEAKACPDGSYVGRDPARNCEFRRCP